MPRARSLTRLNYAEFRDDAFVEVAASLSCHEQPQLRHPKSPRSLQRGESLP
jgi:hypothetical protein